MAAFIRGKVSGAGRVVLPAELRKEFRLEDGAEVVFSRTPHGIRVAPLDLAVRQAQALVRQYVPEEVSLVDGLHAERLKDRTFD